MILGTVDGEEITADNAVALVLKYKTFLKHLERKVAHGCTDFFCEDCDDTTISRRHDEGRPTRNDRKRRA